LDLNDLRYSTKSVDDLTKQDSLLRENDLLFTRYNGNPEYVGVAARVHAGLGPLTYPDKLIRVRVDERLCDPRYVEAAFASPAIRAQVRQLSRTTAGQIGISGGNLKQIRLPLPPRAEQRRIIATLEDHLSRLDAALGAVVSAERRMSSLRTSLFESSLEDRSFRIVRVGSLLREPLTNGRSVQTRVGGFPVLRLTALRNGIIELSERKDGAWTNEDAAPFLVRKDDFFISRGNGSLSLVGRGGLLTADPDPIAFPDTMIRIRVNESHVDSRYLRFVWDSKRVRSQVESAARTTAGIYKINQKIVEEIEIPLPSLTDQVAIVMDVETAFSAIDSCVKELETVVRRGSRLRSSLLAEAFAGRLTQQDPADGNVFELLERIRAERAAVQPRGRRSRRTASKAPQKETLL
jgi:type I restriction enzyme S subunit